MKKYIEGIHRSSRITEIEESVSDLENIMVEITLQNRVQKKRMKRNEDSLRDWDNIKCTNIHIIEREKRERT